MKDEELKVQVADLIDDYGLDKVLSTILHRVSNVAMGCEDYHSLQCEHCVLVQGVGQAWAMVKECPRKVLQTPLDSPGSPEVDRS